MNTLDKQYTDLLQDILDNGVTKSDRTGTGTLSLFGRQIRHKMSEGFPLLTGKKMFFKGIVTELLWFLRGDTNIKYLVDNDCHIWTGDAYKRYADSHTTFKDGFAHTQPIAYSKEEFINKIKTDNEFAKKWGELGPVYGKQWRRWSQYEINMPGFDTHFNETQIDQIANLIAELKTNPDSRRLMVNAWNVGEIDSMVLPPCHYGFQVYTRELSLEERYDYGLDVLGYEGLLDYGHSQNDDDKILEFLNYGEVPKRAISLMWNQRSVDTFLGLPFNIASYGLLLEIIAKEVNMVPDELIGNLGDVHLYSNHIDQAKEQIGRELSLEEVKKIYIDWSLLKSSGGYAGDIKADIIKSANQIFIDGWKNNKDPFTGKPLIELECFLLNYIHTRQPYPLSNLVYLDEYHYLIDKELAGEISFSEKITQFRPDFFKVENYQSHPSIKAPLSN